MRKGENEEGVEQTERIKADDVVATAHSQGLLITFNYDENRHLQAVVGKDQALRLARDILSVMYNMGMKVD